MSGATSLSRDTIIDVTFIVHQLVDLFVRRHLNLGYLSKCFCVFMHMLGWQVENDAPINILMISY